MRGHSLLEATLVLAIIAILACGAVLAMDLRGPALAFLRVELASALDQAFLLARARGSDVRLALGGPGGDVAPVLLPRGVRWGLPATGVPFPPGMDPPKKAHLTGAAHPVITVTPRGTATAGVWFLTDGRDALCLRLAGRGDAHLLRWRQDRHAWVP